MRLSRQIGDLKQCSYVVIMEMSETKAKIRTDTKNRTLRYRLPMEKQQRLEGMRMRGIGNSELNRKFQASLPGQ